jgi:hypothetical protein
MSTQLFQVVVSGKLAPGATREQVQQNIAKLFKTTVDKLGPMFSGERVAVKKDLDPATAAKYQAALQQAGLMAEIAPMAQEVSAPIPATMAKPAQNTPKGDLGGASIEPPGSQIDLTPPPPPAQIDTSKLSAGPVDGFLSTEPPPPPPSIDTSRLQMGAVGEDLVEVLPLITPDYNIEGITLGAPGEIIIEHAPIPEPKIDISKLKLDN